MDEDLKVKDIMTKKYQKQELKEFDFFVKADLSAYKGKYVALLGNKVVASGTNAKEVWEKARRKYPRRVPTLAKLPREEAFVLTW